MAKQDDYTRYTIRIPTPLYERVKAAAGEKSVNAEIVAALDLCYPAPRLPNRIPIEIREAIQAAIYASDWDEAVKRTETLKQVLLKYPDEHLEAEVRKDADGKWDRKVHLWTAYSSALLSRETDDPTP